MTPYYADASVTVHAGDCLDVLRELPDASVDAVVTDPPAAIAFMGKAWDSDKGGRRQWVAWMTDVMTECCRVLKPGGHVFVWALPRTSHWTAWAIEDSGLIVRDCVVHLFGSGFPKSLDVSKAIDKAAGATREVVGTKLGLPGYSLTDGLPGGVAMEGNVDGSLRNGAAECDLTAPATDDARTWQGWGTSLKPASEHWWLARKPLTGTVAGNVLAHGTGALNVDGCRIEGRVQSGAGGWQCPTERVGDLYELGTGRQYNDGGRWPANVVLDESQAAALDAMSGETSNHARSDGRVGHGSDRNPSAYGIRTETTEGTAPKDFGGASRFFFIAREDNEPCPSTSTASTAETPSSHPSETAASAPSGAATSVRPGTARPTLSPSTSVKANGSRPNGVSDTPTTPNIDGKSSPASQQTRPTPTPSPASDAALIGQTDTTTTTTSPSTSGGSVVPATSSTTPKSTAPGVQALPLDALEARFTYTAKADAGERVRIDGIAHPTVKPLSLMRWLVRLVTPPRVSVMVCLECEQNVPGVRRDVPTEAQRSGVVLPVMQAEAGGPGTQAPTDPMSDVRDDSHRRQGAEVLQSGVLRRGAEEAARLHHLSDVIPGEPSDTADVLPSVRVKGGDASAEELRTMRDGLSTEDEQEPILLPSMRGQGVGTGAPRRENQDATRVHPALDARASDVDQSWSDSGTQEGGSGDPGPTARSRRGRTSQERDQGRQSAGELGSPAETGSRPHPETAAEADHLPPLPRQDRGVGTCPQCGGALTQAERPGLILEPFAGSGTTVEAAILEGFRCIAIEREADYLPLIVQRIQRRRDPVAAVLASGEDNGLFDLLGGESA